MDPNQIKIFILFQKIHNILRSQKTTTKKTLYLFYIYMGESKEPKCLFCFPALLGYQRDKLQKAE